MMKNLRSKDRHLPKKRIFYASMIFFLLVSSAYLITLDRMVVERFEGKIWKLPAKVYARPLELYAGKYLSIDRFQQELDLLGYQRVDQIPQSEGQYQHWQDTYEVRTRRFRFWDAVEESIGVRIAFEDGKVATITDLYSSESLSLIRLDPVYLTGIFPAHNEDRVLVRFEEVTPALIKTLVLIEDRRFFEHHGIDPYAIARAFVANLSAGRTVQGGSTITQQLVKNLFLSPERSLIRKANEAFMAMLLELHYDKRTILETYLNEIYLGQDGDRAIHGFGLASQYYFGRTVDRLSLAEIATLIGMAKGASYYDPVRFPERSTSRRNVVLRSMRDAGLITGYQYDIQSSRAMAARRGQNRKAYPGFMAMVRRQLASDFEQSDLQNEGLNVFTTLDPVIQNQTERAISEVLPGIDRTGGKLQGASVILRPGSGDVLAAVGDVSPQYQGFNRVLDAYRPIGSLVKPFVYYAALASDRNYHLASVLQDEPFEYVGEDRQIWRPENYDKEFQGDILLIDALKQSRNVPTARVAVDIGADAVVEALRNFGLQRDIPSYPSISLGAVEMSPYEVASIYQTIASDGFGASINSVIAITDSTGERLTRYPIDIQKNTDPGVLTLIQYALSRVTVDGTASRLRSSFPVAVAGKTGTSDDFRDSWFVGFNRELLGVVWVGRDDNRPMGLTGSSGAMMLWAEMMQGLMEEPYFVETKLDVSMKYINAETGASSAAGCPDAIRLPFIEGIQPVDEDDCLTARRERELSDIFDD